MQYFFKDHFYWIGFHGYKWSFIAVIAFSLVAAFFLAYHEKHLSLKIILIIYSTLFLDLGATDDDLGIEWAIIKGVSDYAGDIKPESDCDSWRSFASLMAVSVVAHVLSDVNLFWSWPHYEDKEGKWS